MTTDMDATYEEYVEWVATLKGGGTPYSRKQWDRMTASHKFGINLAMQRKKAQQ